MSASTEIELLWLNRQQLSDLFNRDIKTIGKHINNALKEELKNMSTVAKFAIVQKEGNRISATLFLEFLNRNNALYRDGIKVISESALVAITLLVAESNPEEKNVMVYLIMNFLT